MAYSTEAAFYLERRLMFVRGRVQFGCGLVSQGACIPSHEYKVAHRDINPGNLVCDAFFLFQISNFDVAVKVGTITRRLTNIAARRTGQHVKWESEMERRQCVVTPSRPIGGHVGEAARCEEAQACSD